MFRVALVLFLAFAAFGLGGCDTERLPPLVDVRELSPRDVEVGDRLELHGVGFPQGRAARVTFRGTLLRAGTRAVRGAHIEAQGVVTRSDRVEVLVTDAVEEGFCGRGDAAAHATMTGDVEVAFASSTPSAPPLVGVLRGVAIDVTPSSLRADVHASRKSEGTRVLAFLGIAAAEPSPRGLPIERVVAGSAAERAGFQAGDVLVAVDGVHVRDFSDVVPASMRAVDLTIRRADSGTEETLSVPMTGYSGRRIPVEYEPALCVLGLALAALFLLVVPLPSRVSALEQRIARRLTAARVASLSRAVFGGGASSIGATVCVSVLLGAFALGPHVFAPDLDAAALLVAGIAFVLARHLAGARGVRASAKAVLRTGVPGLALAASTLGVIVDRGALRLAELVRAQGGAPWELAAFRHPALAALAFVYVSALVVLVRSRVEGPLVTDAHAAATSPPSSTHARGPHFERIGLVLLCALGVAVFFGGWQLPFAVSVRSWPIELAAALWFTTKSWMLAAAVIAASAVGSPWSDASAHAFVRRVLVPALAVAAIFSTVDRFVSPGAAIEAALGLAITGAIALLVVRVALRVRGAMVQPEPHVSPFL